MEILVISDKVSPILYKDYRRDRFGKIDMIISAGDLPAYYMNFLIDAFNVPCFFVPGNHDNHMVKEFPLGWVNLHGKIVEHKGLKIAGIGGSPFYNGESPFQYTEDQIFWKCLGLSLKLRWKNKIDIFVTHSPAYNMGDLPETHVHRGFKAFTSILNRHQPKLFLYGHTHLDYGVKRIGIYQDTLLINAYEQYRFNFHEIDKIKAENSENVYTNNLSTKKSFKRSNLVRN